MATDTEALGKPIEEKGQVEDLQERNPKATVVGADGKTVKGETETPQKTEEKETPSENLKEDTHEEDVELLKQEAKKKDKRIKDQEEHIGKQSTEIGDMRKVMDTVKDATTPQEKKDIQSRVDAIYESSKKHYIDTYGWTEKEAEAYLKPMRDMTLAAKDEAKLERRTERLKREVVAADDFVKTSKDINEQVFREYETQITEELKTYHPDWIVNNMEKAILKAYKSVTNAEANKKRRANRKGDEETRESEISNQPASTPKSKSKAEDASAYTAENIRNAGTGRIFET